MSIQPFVQPGEPLNDFLRSFWQRQVSTAEQETPDHHHPPLPLARIKKVMKSDPDVKMIAADAPILFCKACEMFISEISARAFIVADANKRRTLTRADIAKALSKSDQFDFLIDIFPRDDIPFGAAAAGNKAGSLGSKQTSSTNAEESSMGGLSLESTDGGSDGNNGFVVLKQLESLLNPVPTDRESPSSSHRPF